MAEEKPSAHGLGTKSWLERLSQVFGSEPRDVEALIRVLREAQQRGVIDMDTHSMLEGVLQITDMQARDIMVPRAQMVVIERDDPLDKITAVATESGFSRFPVIGETRDDVVGIILAKDLLRFQSDSRTNFSLREILRPVTFIPESKRLSVLLKEFRVSRNHLAVVVDEYGGVAGLVTIEDVLEQVVGEIEDEHDTEEDDNISHHADGRYLIKALTPIEDFNAYFDMSFSDEEYDTVAGLLMSAFGHLPHRGETVQIGRCEFRVVRADSRRVHLVQMNLLPDATIKR